MTRQRPPAPLNPLQLEKARLEDARRYPGCVVMLGCLICGYAKGYMVEKVILRLHQSGAGGFQTPVADIASMAKVLCPRCKGKHWTSQFAYPAHLQERDLKRLAARARN